jgi:hypothetical protein
MPPKIRRPAAVAAVAKAAAGGVRRLRRPSAAEEKVGGVIASADVTLAQCRDMKDIEVVDGSYWTGVCKAALRIKEARVKDGQLYLMAQVLGTQNEDLLRAASGRRGQAIEAHLCDKECAGTPHAEGLLHVKQLRHLGAHREDWMGNLVPADRRGEAEDDLVELRRDRDALMGGDRREGRGEAERASPPRRGEEGDQKRARKRSRSRRRRKAKLKIEATKDLKNLLGNTGADPEPGIRKKFRKKASKIAKKKTKGSRGESSNSSSSSTTTRSGDKTLFGSTSRVQTIGKRLPGTLLCAALEEASEALVTQEGGIWDTTSGPLPPLFTRYYRQQLAPKMSPAMSREAQTLAQALDYGLRGRFAEMMDLCGQRLKALEMQMNGVHYSVSQQQELLPREGVSLSTTPEFREAARLAREEGKSRLEASRPYGTRPGFTGKSEDWSKGGGKKGAGKGKNQKGDQKKGDGDRGDAKKSKGS